MNDRRVWVGGDVIGAGVDVCYAGDGEEGFVGAGVEAEGVVAFDCEVC